MGLFGPTKKGGGLDKRFSSNKGGYLGKASRFASSFGGGDDYGYSSNDRQEGEDYLSRFTFQGDVDSICAELDELLKVAAQQKDYRTAEPVMSKIESGIFHLERKDSSIEAKYYSKKLAENKKKFKSKKIGTIIFLAIFFAAVIGSAIYIVMNEDQF